MSFTTIKTLLFAEDITSDLSSNAQVASKNLSESQLELLEKCDQIYEESAYMKDCSNNARIYHPIIERDLKILLLKLILADDEGLREVLFSEDYNFAQLLNFLNEELKN